MPKTVRIGEHIFILPQDPVTQDDVLFVKDKRENQRWRRQTDFPKIFFDFIPGYTKENSDATLYDSSGVLRMVSVQDTEILHRLLVRELKRRVYGIHYMNDGDLNYLTGDHYFTLQWGQMHGYTNPETNDGYGEYRQFQRDIFFFIQLCFQETNTFGGFIAKAKKTGVTQLMALMFLNRSTMIKEKRFLMMSKSHVDAKFTNMMFFQHGLEGLPPIMKPAIGNLNQSTVSFDQPKIRFTGSKMNMQQQQIRAMQGSGYKTTVEAVPTKEDAMDGPKVYVAWKDEFPKYKNPGPKKVFDKSSESVKLQQTKYGTDFYTSYPPENDSAGFFEAKEIYFNSALSTLNELGQTKSGLLKFFVSALDSTEGTLDRFGRPDRTKAFYINDTDRKSVGNNRSEKQKKKRQYPRTEKECWESGGSGSTFDNIRLGMRDAELEEEENNGAVHFKEGFLEYTNGEGSPLYFRELTQRQREENVEPYWRQYVPLLPEEVNRVILNQHRDWEGNLMPYRDNPFTGAIDPTDYKEKKDVLEGSKNAITVMNELDLIKNTRFGYNVTNALVLEFLFRADDPDEIEEEAVKVILYTGGYFIIEANKGWLFTRLKKRGLGNFLLYKDRKKKMIRTIEPGDELQPINTETESINEYCRAIARYFREPPTVEDIDWLAYFKSRRAIAQLMDFDPMATKVSDLVVALGYNLLAKEAIAALRILWAQEDEQYEPGLMQSIVDKILYL